MRAAIYARYSSDLQRETSIADQVAVARRYAAQQNWVVLDDHLYQDAGVSGASIEGRPGIQALLSAAAQKPAPFDVVLVDDSSRVARDLRDALHVLHLLKFCRVRVIYISQQIDSANEQAETLMTIHGLVDGLYLREGAKKIRRGLIGQQERGFATGGRTFGYRAVPEFDLNGRLDPYGQPVRLGNRLEIVPEEATVIVRIFDAYAQGLSIPRIIETLMTHGVPPPRGGRWHKGGIRRILQNEKYRGYQIWGQTAVEREPETRRIVATPQPRERWHVIDRPELRIVSEDLWARVQNRRAEVRETFHRGGRRGSRSELYSRFLFSGFLRCGGCKGPITIISHGHGSPRYGCIRSVNNGRLACANRLSIRAKVAEPVLLQGLSAELVRPETIDYITDAVNKAASAANDQPRRRVELRRAREKAAGRVQRLVAAIEDGLPSSSVRQALAEREAELRQLDAELDQLDDHPCPLPDVTPEWVEGQLTDLAGLLGDSPERTRAEFTRLNLRFTLSPIMDVERPYLQAEGVADLGAFCFNAALPSSGRGRFPITDHSHLPPRH